MKCLFIINPVSGTKVIQKNLDRIIGTLILDTDVSTVDTFYTEKKNDAMYKAALLKAGDYDFIVSVGGDGTVNEVLMGLINSNSHIPVALIPAGTVNDFANYLKLPTTPHEFAKMIKNFKTIKADVGQEAHSDICFANVLSGGMFSDIAFMVTKELKNTFGPLAYYVTGIKELPAQLAMNLHLKVTADH
ncbi:diacylglycerol/lipid kinase family protein, partial [Sharpea azabuensis]|uniref:diacylglycerol/lipid kinase family protein n=1 Tax=Sharpea azabuensis TaxID=322505 RepID=UPI003D050C6A